MVILLTFLSEELVEQLRGTFHEHQATVFGAVEGEVQKALDGLHSIKCYLCSGSSFRRVHPPLPIWILVTVRPGTPIEVLPTGQRNIHPVKRADELLGLPQFLKNLNNCRL